jgi:hypothetical protein
MNESCVSWVLCSLCIQESLDGCSMDGSDCGLVEMNRPCMLGWESIYTVLISAFTLVIESLVDS